ncbi:MAG: acyl-CoA thioesterase [Candidatus Omnitrophica bacterium]|nr:acyl-CoA thioesterase [Candidatus Omnitrophota bacterium]
MNLLLRCFWVYLGSFFRKPLSFLDSSILSFHVLPHDLDIYAHMNNGRYMSIMDLGRWDLILRTGLYRRIAEKKWNPIVASSFIRYRRPLFLGEAYELHTRILGWTRKWFFLEQVFVRNEKTVARAYVKGLFIGPGGSIPCSEVLRLLNIKTESPELPRAIAAWVERAADTAVTDGD